MKQNKLNQKWLEKLQKDEQINITDLYEFSKIKLKRRRMRKKFHKHYDRYVPNEIKEAYWAVCFATPITENFKKQMKFNLKDIKPIDETPKVQLVYPDYQYQSDINNDSIT